jgi:hypothetical protein
MLYSFYLSLSDGMLLNFLVGLCAFNEIFGADLNITAAWITKVLGGLALFREKYLASEAGGAGPAATEAKNAARAVVIEILNEFTHTQVKYNKLFTKEMLILAGWPEPESGSKGILIIVAPVIRLVSKLNGFLTAFAKCTSVSGRGMAPFAVFFQVCWAFANEDGTFPSANEILGRDSRYAFKATLEFRVLPEDAGRKLVAYGRYHNHNPEPGPWSAPVFITVT